MDLSLNTNVLIDAIALLLIGIIRLSLAKQASDRIIRRVFDALLSIACAILVLDIPAWMLDGAQFPMARVILMVLNTAYYALQIVFCGCWFVFADVWCGTTRESIERYAAVALIPMAIELVAILSSFYTGWIFTLDEANVYHRGAGYTINLVSYYGYIFGTVLLMLWRYHKEKDAPKKQQILQFTLYMVLPICGMVVESFYYGVSLVWPFTVLCLIMIYNNIQQQRLAMQQIELATKEKELAESRIAITLSQIQPHFLYNALGSIYRLCDKNPPAAKEATGYFAKYLRTNLDSLKLDAPVPFTTELRHIQVYLYLEKMRFEDELDVVYDIQTEGFLIPVLTVQPLVENAVKYGVGKKPGGGTVTITAKESKQGTQVIVSDNGVGFNPYETRTDGRTHVGIENVKTRLGLMVGGTLTIESQRGRGTTAVITIPRGESANEDSCGG